MRYHHLRCCRNPTFLRIPFFSVFFHFLCDLCDSLSHCAHQNPRGESHMAYQLPPLPYAYDALDPYIDEATMKLHHDKHHQAYVTNLNGAIDKHPDLGSKSPEDRSEERRVGKECRSRCAPHHR